MWHITCIPTSDICGNVTDRSMPLIPTHHSKLGIAPLGTIKTSMRGSVVCLDHLNYLGGKELQHTVVVTQTTDSQNINYTGNFYNAVTITPAEVCSVKRGPIADLICWDKYKFITSLEILGISVSSEFGWLSIDDF